MPAAPAFVQDLLGLLIAATALVLIGLGVLAPAARAELSAQSMLSPATVTAIDLQLPPASLAALEDEPGEYVEGSFRIAESGGTPATIGEFSDPLTVGVRLKGGSGSFKDLDGKAAFKVKFAEFVPKQKFLGLKSLTLNNMVQDPSMIHEALAYQAFRAAGIPAPHTGYAYVHLNGIDYGLHLNLETMDDVALEKRFGPFDDPQHLYEGGPGFDVTPGGAGAFQVDEGDDGDLSDLEALIAAANEPSPEFSTRLAPVADVPQMRRFWAAERYLAQWDGYSGQHRNNYYLYSDPDGVFQMLPWGTDQSLDHQAYPFTGHGGILFEQCLAEPACLEGYEEDLVEVAASTAALDPAAEVDELAALLAPWQALEIEHSTRAPYGAGKIAAEVAKVERFLAKRPGALSHWLAFGTLPPDPENEEEDEGEEDEAPPQLQAPKPAEASAPPASPLPPGDIRKPQVKLLGIPGKCVEEGFRFRVAVSDEGGIGGIEVRLNGEPLPTAKLGRAFEVRVPDAKLDRSGRYRIKVVARDGSGNMKRKSAGFRVCDRT
jgi:hypothetical protein